MDSKTEKNFNIDIVCALSKLHITDVDKENISKEMNDIISFASQISFASTANTEKASSVSDLRDDVALDSLSTELLLSNCAEHDGQYVIVPRTVE